jgi:PhzF family phenazine biosynthesis protein
MGLKIVQVDAFASEAFTGNPAAVCILNEAVDSDWMQNVALEMNLSETAFLLREGQGYRLRWFTPAAEVELCGHATLASAHVLWQDGHLKPDQRAEFSTLSGELAADREDDLICLDFPATPVASVEASDLPPMLIEAVGCRPAFVGRSKFDYLVELSSEEELRGLSPDMSGIVRAGARGVIATARGEEYDFVSRFFAPAVGVPEDPVTGSAHCALASYWADKLGRSELRAFQASQRGGIVHVAVSGDRVKLKGTAVTTLRGELCVHP